jgi:hypothetical protein
MKTKKSYQQPVINSILFDREISLILQSAPPEGPDEYGRSADYHQINPLTNTLT